MIIGLGEISSSSENQIFISNKNISKFNFLLFFDSRTMTINEDDYFGSLLFKLKNILEEKKYSYIIISRPKNLTIFPTLYNFLMLNPNLKFNNLITNIGFVDCTPKKQENIDDIKLQISQFCNIENETVYHEKYQLNDGSEETLQSLEYSKEYIKKIVEEFKIKFKKCYFINTPLIDKKIKIERKRPNSFFIQLHKTNNLIDTIVGLDKEKNILIDIKDINDTYDGVHYTEIGHKKIFNKIRESLKL